MSDCVKVTTATSPTGSICSQRREAVRAMAESPNHGRRKTAAPEGDRQRIATNLLGLGLFVSTISNTQQQAMMTSTFFFMTPMMYLSGFVFPIENMPRVIQPLTYLIPLRYFVIILRGIFLKGVGLETLWPHALGLLAWGVVILTLAVLRSSKRLA